MGKSKTEIFIFLVFSFFFPKVQKIFLVSFFQKIIFCIFFWEMEKKLNYSETKLQLEKYTQNIHSSLENFITSQNKKELQLEFISSQIQEFQNLIDEILLYVQKEERNKPFKLLIKEYKPILKEYKKELESKKSSFIRQELIGEQKEEEKKKKRIFYKRRIYELWIRNTN